MTRLVVVSGDPGEFCGYGISSFDCKLLLKEGLVGGLRSLRGAYGQFRLGSTTANVDRHLEIARYAFENLCDEDDLFVLVQESFQLRMLSSEPSLLEPVRFNAVLVDRLAGVEEDARPVLEWQTPSDAKSSINDARLNLWGQSERTRGKDHAKDAQRHGYYYARRWASDGAVRYRSGWDG